MNGTDGADDDVDPDERASVNSGRTEMSARTDRTETQRRGVGESARGSRRGSPQRFVVAPAEALVSVAPVVAAAIGSANARKGSAVVGNGGVVKQAVAAAPTTTTSRTAARPSAVSPSKSPSLMSRLSERLTRSRSEKKVVGA